MAKNDLKSPPLDILGRPLSGIDVFLNQTGETIAVLLLTPLKYITSSVISGIYSIFYPEPIIISTRPEDPDIGRGCYQTHYSDAYRKDKYQLPTDRIRGTPS